MEIVLSELEVYIKIYKSKREAFISVQFAIYSVAFVSDFNRKNG